MGLTLKLGGMPDVAFVKVVILRAAKLAVLSPTCRGVPV